MMRKTSLDLAIETMFGRTVASVTVSADRERIVFAFADGYRQAFEVDGDCCSTSWIEHLEMPNDVVGAVITGATHLDVEEGDDSRDGECIQVYQTHFHTTKGDICLEFRNSSNGFYGGSLWPIDANRCSVDGADRCEAQP